MELPIIIILWVGLFALFFKITESFLGYEMPKSNLLGGTKYMTACIIRIKTTKAP